MKKRGVQPEELRHAVRDLVALSTMPAAWIGCDPHRLAEDVADLLRSALRLDVVGIRFQTSDSETCIEAWRGNPSSAFPEWLRDMETSQELRQPSQGGTTRVAGLAATDTALRVVVAPLGEQGGCGGAVVGCAGRGVS